MRLLRYFSFPLFWAFAVLGLYAVSGSEISQISFWSILKFDKIAHAGVFALLSVSLIVACRKQSENKFLRKNAILMSVLFCGVYGGVLELLQGTIFEDRVSDPIDFLANIAGSMLGIVVFRIIYGKALFNVN